MISVSQAVQGLTEAVPSPTAQLSRTALIAASLPTESATSVRLSAQTATLGVLLYTPTGTLSVPVNEGVDVTLPSTVTGGESATASAVESTSLNAPVPGAPLATVPATGASPASPVAAENTEAAVAPLTPSMVNVLVTNVFVDPTTKALADFTANPVHGNLATALLLNAANYRARQVSSATLVNAIDLPGPVASLDAISVDIADLNDQSTGRQGQPPRAFASNA